MISQIHLRGDVGRLKTTQFIVLGRDEKKRHYGLWRITYHTGSIVARTGGAITTDLFVVFRRHHFVPDSESRVALVAQVIRVRVGAGRVVLDERQPHRLVAGPLEVVFARRVGRQRVPGAVQ